MKKVAFTIFYFFLVSTGFAADEITGFWKTINEDGIAQCIIAIYEFEGIRYGRIIATFDDAGKIKDSIYFPVERAPGVINNPYYSGLDIIWGLVEKTYHFKGKILDPEKGNIYNSELWIENGALVVRGKLLIFGRSQKWLPVLEKDIPKNFKLPDTSKFIPSIPVVK
jgi:uncharacterized protein (DUF2147 family)